MEEMMDDVGKEGGNEREKGEVGKEREHGG